MCAGLMGQNDTGEKMDEQLNAQNRYFDTKHFKLIVIISIVL